jgi:hypothetical protein
MNASYEITCSRVKSKENSNNGWTRSRHTVWFNGNAQERTSNRVEITDALPTVHLGCIWRPHFIHNRPISSSFRPPPPSAPPHPHFPIRTHHTLALLFATVGDPRRRWCGRRGRVGRGRRRKTPIGSQATARKVTPPPANALTTPFVRRRSRRRGGVCGREADVVVVPYEGGGRWRCWGGLRRLFEDAGSPLALGQRRRRRRGFPGGPWAHAERDPRRHSGDQAHEAAQ